jgi:rhodanese-related sulfurtransferase
MTVNVKLMLHAANAAVPKISPAQAKEILADTPALLIDVRDAPEVQRSGKIVGALHISRGMLEFRADPDTPYFEKQFDKNKAIILYCASGGRSALSAKTLKHMGYEMVFNLGAFQDWVDSGGAVEKVPAC